MAGVEESVLSSAEDAETPPARLARRATLFLLVVGAVTSASLVVWSFYIRGTHVDPRIARAGLRSGLELAARINTEYLAALGGLALLAFGLAYALYLRRPWASIVTFLGS